METKPDALAPAQQFEVRQAVYGKDSVKYCVSVQSAYFARKLFPLVERLGTECPEGWGLEVKDLGLLFKQLTVFLETAFGRNSTERQFPKLPARLLRDASVNGSVHFLLKTYNSFLKAHSIKHTDFVEADPAGQKMEFVMYAREALLKAGLLKVPVVHVDGSTGDRRDELEAIVRSLGGTVSASSDDPSVTHIVYPFGPDGDPDDGIQYLRSLEMRPGEYFVHYWYYPDSYDNWMPADVAPENLEPDRKPIGPWKVYVRWLRDSQKFNEWMNPIDYETEEFQDEQEALQDQAEDTKTLEEEEDEEESNGVNSDEDVDSVMTDEKTLQKRKRDALHDFLATGSSTGQDLMVDDNTARRLRSDSHRPEVDEAAAVKVAPNVTKHTVLDISKAAFSGTVENISQCVDERVMDVDGATDTEDPTDAHKQLYTVPAHASWFDWDNVHAIEKEGVPLKCEEHEEGGIDSEVYRRSRNAMIDKFREKPHRRLSFSDTRKRVAGNVDDLRKMFEFLTKWGLINYFPASTSHGLKHKKGDADDGISVSLPTSAPPLIHFSNSVTLPEMNAAVTHGNELAFSLLHKTNKYGKTVTDASSQPGGIRCSAMPWIDCTESCYHCVTLPNIDLCPQAFKEGRFPSGTAAKDYILLSGTQSQKTDGAGWTDQETLLLLEAIEIYRDDWAEIAEHVATKSQLQCAMHWLTMSIEDDFVDELLSKDDAVFQGTNENFLKSLPFSDARNPVMAQIAFLATVVSPEVAGAAAQEALNYLSQADVEKADPLHDGQMTAQTLDSSSLSLEKRNFSELVCVFRRGGLGLESMRMAAVAALKSAAVKAKLLAEQQEREIQRLMNTVIEAQIKKIEIKLNYCAEQDKALDDERGRLEAARLQVNADRLQLRSVLNRPRDAQPSGAASTMEKMPMDNGVSPKEPRHNGQQ